MASFQNQGQVPNQVGGSQNVQGSVYLGPVNHTTVYENGGRHSDKRTASRCSNNEILSTLSFPQMLHRRANIRDPHHSTCQWIFNLPEYKSWISQPSGLLWIKGKPGAGKSTVMSFLYRRLKEQSTKLDIHLEFFFSARGVELQRTPTGMFRSLLTQLFNQHSEAQCLIREVYEENSRGFGSPSHHMWDWQTPELESLLTKCLSTLAGHRQVNIFLDALDEVGKLATQEVAGYFHRLHDHLVSIDASVRICMSSRHYPLPATTTRGAEVSVEDHNVDDIRRFVHDCLDLKHRAGDDYADIEEWHDLAHDLTRRANGIFQWVCLVVPILEQHLDDGDSLADARQHLDHVPRELERMYDYILRTVIDERHRQRSFELFRLVCLASRPLSLSEVRHALAVSKIPAGGTRAKVRDSRVFIKTDDRLERQLKALSGGLIEAVRDDHPLGGSADGFWHRTTVNAEQARRFKARTGSKQELRIVVTQVIHQSVTDFILTHGLAVLSRLCHATTSPTTRPIDLICEGHTAMFWTCVNYLDSEDIQMSDKCVLARDSSWPFRPTAGSILIRRRILLEEHPLVLYAAANMTKHAYLASQSNFLEYQCDLSIQILALDAVLPKWYYIMSAFFHQELGVGYGCSLAHVAAEANLTAMLDKLLSTHPLVNSIDRHGLTPLHVAAHRGHNEAIEMLVRKGADVNVKSNNGQTALALAVESGLLDVVKCLIRYNGGSHDTGVDLKTSLNHAAAGGFNAIARLLIVAGADANDRDANGSCTALRQAIWNGHEDMTQLLIDAGADANALSSEHGSALETACEVLSLTAVRILLDAGADIDQPSASKNRYAFHTACWTGDIEVVKLLVEAGADVHIRGGRFGTALQAAAASCEMGVEGEQIVQLLLSLGHDVNVRDGYHGSALQAACSQEGDQALSMVKMLITAGASVNAQGGVKGSALEEAAYAQGSEELVKYLLAVGADVNHFTPSENITEMRSEPYFHDGPSLENVRSLLDAGASLDPPRGFLAYTVWYAMANKSSEWSRELVDMFELFGATRESLTELYYSFERARAQHAPGCVDGGDVML